MGENYEDVNCFCTVLSILPLLPGLSYYYRDFVS